MQEQWGNVYDSNSIPLLWNGFRTALKELDERIEKIPYPADIDGVALATKYLSRLFRAIEKPVCLFIDDFILYWYLAN